MARKIKIVEGEYYHILFRGNYKQLVFFETRDYIRFLFCLLYFQSPITFNQISRQVTYFEKYKHFDINKKIINDIVCQRQVELITFILMPNHIHLILREKIQGGISGYMERVLKAYTKYFNTKYQKQGHLFQGPFKNIHIPNNEYLLHLSAYIHQNCKEISRWKKKENLYPWSSYQDYVSKNRWGELLKTEIILGQFKNQQVYEEFLLTSPAKENVLSDTPFRTFD